MIMLNSVIDLSHELTNGMPVFPGSEPAMLKRVAGIAADGFNELSLIISGHTGTHIDVGRHVFASGFALSDLQADAFYGKGLVIDCRNDVKKGLIMPGVLQSSERLIGLSEFVLLHTGWSRWWGDRQYYENPPVPDLRAAEYLSAFSLKGIGIDAPGFDPINNIELPVHKMLLSRGIVLIENLTRLEELPASDFMFCCFPLNIKDGDGSPVRAVGLVEV